MGPGARRSVRDCRARVDRQSTFWVTRWKDLADGATFLRYRGTEHLARISCATFGFACKTLP